MNKILCIQISTQLINGKQDNKDIATKYYNTLYNTKNKDGYYKSNHFWECPLWVTEIDHNIATDFYICENVKDTVDYLLSHNYDYVCFSVLDVNKAIVKEIIAKFNIVHWIKHKTDITVFAIGGYIDFAYFDNIYNVVVFKTIKDVIEYLNIEYKQGNNYRLFKDYETIPRLTLSTGCTNKCDFCTVEKQIVDKSLDVIIQQVNAFKPLKFKLVYINDKTFGQCSNYKTLPMIYKKIKEYNSYFEGFIIQTTTTTFNKLDRIFLYGAYIKYVELGIETYNNDILKKYHKPSTEETTDKACKRIRTCNKYFTCSDNIKLIPNIICGMPEETIETYLNTLNFIKDNVDIISHLNIYSLTVYNNTPLADRIEINDNNNNENSLDKSFLTGTHHKQFYNAIHRLGIEILIENAWMAF